jgi:hypothetical protein
MRRPIAISHVVKFIRVIIRLDGEILVQIYNRLKHEQPVK